MGDKLTIVYTPLHGSGNIPVRRALADMGFTRVFVVPEQEKPDPTFHTVRVPNPEDPAAFKLALELQKKVHADLVFGTDPDCDRVGIAVLDGEGEGACCSAATRSAACCCTTSSTAAGANGTLPKNAAAVKSIVSTELARAIC